MRVKFEEGPDGVFVKDARSRFVRRGEVVDVPARVGRRLVEQGWTEVAAPKKVDKGDG